MASTYRWGLVFVLIWGTFLQGATPGAAARRRNRAPASTTTDLLDENAPAAAASDAFDLFSLPFSIGIEGPAVAQTSVFQESAVSFGWWVTHEIGLELYLGYSKASGDAMTQTVTDSSTAPGVGGVTSTTSTTTTTTYSGNNTPRQILFGGAFKYRVYQSRYFGVSTDLLLTYTLGSSTSTPVGSQVTTINDITQPGNATRRTRYCDSEAKAWSRTC